MAVSRDKQSLTSHFDCNQESDDDDYENRFVICLDDEPQSESDRDAFDQNSFQPEVPPFDAVVAPVQRKETSHHSSIGNSEGMENGPETVCNTNTTTCNTVGSSNPIASELMHGRIDRDIALLTSSENLKHHVNFNPHENCSCIMCYQGRGINESNRSVSVGNQFVPVSLNISHVNGSISSHANAHRVSTASSTVQILPQNTLPNISQTGSIKYLNAAKQTGSQSNLSNVNSNVYALSPMSKVPQNRAFLIFPPGHLSISPTISSSTTSVTSTSTISSASTLNVSSISPKIKSQNNFTVPTGGQPISLLSGNSKQLPIQPQKRHVMFVDKKNADQQLSGIEDLLGSATKIDMSKPSLVLVHFKISQDQVSSTDSVISSKSKLKNGINSSNVHSKKRVHKSLVNMLKSHLTEPNNEQPYQQILSKKIAVVASTPSIHENIPNRSCGKIHTNVAQTNFNCSGNLSTLDQIIAARPKSSSSILPPLPPLMPRPYSNQQNIPRPLINHDVHKSYIEDEMETMVLPLPKHRSLSSGAMAMTHVSKQDEILKTSNIFTFSAHNESSPSKESQISTTVLSRHISPSISLSSDQSITVKASSITSPSYSFSSITSSCIRDSESYSKSTSFSLTSPTATVCQSQQLNTEMPHVSNKFAEVSYSDSERHVDKTVSNITEGSITFPNNITSPFVSQSQSAISIVNDINHLKMKICFADKKPHVESVTTNKMMPKDCSGSSLKNVHSNKISPKSPSLEKAKSKPFTSHSLVYNKPHVESVTSNKEQSKDGSDSSSINVHSNQISSKNSSSENSKPNTFTFQNPEVQPSKSRNESPLTSTTASKSKRIETAEEMFKRFEDQATQQVYNAQFGAGDVIRSLRPNRTTFPLSSYYKRFKTTVSDGSSEKGECMKDKSGKLNGGNGQQKPITGGDGKQTMKIVKNNRKRPSGEICQKEVTRKKKKSGINHYPKLLPDNSITEGKAIFTPNILAGHKVFVKFNVFSNNQTNRNFLVPFFNIGGSQSRTQFDVEDMDYINKAVAEFENEEKTCARHLIYYSREGKKATFLRKERGFCGSDLNSYSKCSYILEGYKIERQKQASPDEWKIDNKVQVEIDVADHDADIENTVTDNHEICHDKDSVQISSLHSTAKRTFYDNDIEPEERNVEACSPCPDAELPLSMSNEANFSKQISQKNKLDDCHKRLEMFLSNQAKHSNGRHKDKLNILRRHLNKNSVSRKSPNFQCSKLTTLFSEPACLKDLEKTIVTQETQEKLSNICSSAFPVLESATSQDYDQTSPTSNSIHEVESIPHIKTELPDTGYEAALSTNHSECKFNDFIDIDIKSEPIEDYTECLAKSMNMYLNKSSTLRENENHLNLANESGNLIHSITTNINQSEEMADVNDVITSNDNINKEKDGAVSKQILEPKIKLEPFSLDEENSETGNSIDCESMRSCTKPKEDSFLESKQSHSPSDPEPPSFSSDSETTVDGFESEDDGRPLIESLTNINAANVKITSLVESLKERLKEENSLFPTFSPVNFDEREITKNKKKRKGDQQTKKSITNEVSKFNIPSLPADIDVNKSLITNTQIIKSHVFVPLAGQCVPHNIEDQMPDSTFPLKFQKNACSVGSKSATTVSSTSISIPNDKSSKYNSHKIVENNLLKLSVLSPKRSNNEHLKHKTSVSDASITNQYEINLHTTSVSERNKQIKDDVSLRRQVKHASISKQNTLNLSRKSTHFDSDHSSSNSDIEIDVGTDEISNTNTALLANEDRKQNDHFNISSQVLAISKNDMIKDDSLTSEYKWVAPWKSKQLNRLQKKNKKPSLKADAYSTSTLITQTTDKGNNLSFSTDIEKRAKILKTNLSKQNEKPSIASLLCQRMAIEAELVVPDFPKRNITSAALSPSIKMHEISTHTPQSTESGSLYKPTLSAIFGVDNVSLPLSAQESSQFDVDSCSNNSARPQRKQVATKSTNNGRKLKNSLRNKGETCRATSLISSKSKPILNQSTHQLKLKLKISQNMVPVSSKASEVEMTYSTVTNMDSKISPPPAMNKSKKGKECSSKPVTKGRNILHKITSRLSSNDKNDNTLKSLSYKRNSSSLQETLSSPEPNKKHLKEDSKTFPKITGSTVDKGCTKNMDKKKLNVHSAFRTWRQLSHEAKKEKLKSIFKDKVSYQNSQNIDSASRNENVQKVKSTSFDKQNSTKPCKVVLGMPTVLSNREKQSQNNVTSSCYVVLQRLEYMELDCFKHQVKCPVVDAHTNKFEVHVEDNEEILLEQINKQETEDDDQDKKQTIGPRKRKKKPLMKVPKKRQTQERKKKDIVDYYESMLETLRKKAQMLEEEERREKEDNLKKSQDVNILETRNEESSENTSLCHDLDKVHSQTLQMKHSKSNTFSNQIDPADEILCQERETIKENDFSDLEIVSDFREDKLCIKNKTYIDHKIDQGSLSISNEAEIHNDNKNDNDILHLKEYERSQNQSKDQSDLAILDDASCSGKNSTMERKVVNELNVDSYENVSPIVSKDVIEIIEKEPEEKKMIYNPNLGSYQLEAVDSHVSENDKFDTVKEGSSTCIPQVDVGLQKINKIDTSDTHIQNCLPFSESSSKTIENTNSENSDVTQEKAHLTASFSDIVIVDSKDSVQNSFREVNLKGEVGRSDSDVTEISAKSIGHIHSKDLKENCTLLNDIEYHSDISEAGPLIIDYEDDIALSNAKNSKEIDNSHDNLLYEKKERMNLSYSTPFDLSQSSDSSFKPKDIVLGFEDELGADTVFSSTTISQDNETEDDLFLLEAGEDEPSIGIIPDDEVEKLLGLDHVNDDEAKKENLKNGKSKALVDTSLESSFCGKTKLNWIPLVESENKHKEVMPIKENDTCVNTNSNLNIPGYRQIHLNEKSTPDHSQNSKIDGNNLQLQQKKQPVSPSWNRLLGSHALKEMEESTSTSVTNSQSHSQFSHKPISDKPPFLKDPGKLKINTGALSKALKLSAEMKKAFSDVVSQNSAGEWSSTLKEKSKMETEIRHFANKVEKSLVSGQNFESNTAIRSNIDCEMNISESKNIGRQSQCQPDNFNLTSCEVLQNIPRSSRKKCKIDDGDNDKIRIIVSGSVKLSEKSQELSMDSKNRNDNPFKLIMPTSSNFSSLSSLAKGIDINKLKLKLNPLLSLSINKNMQQLPSCSKSKVKKDETLTSSVDSTFNKNFKYTNSADCIDQINPIENSLGIAGAFSDKEPTPKNLSGDNDPSVTKTSLDSGPLKRSIQTGKPRINTTKLSNLLKNLKNPLVNTKVKEPNTNNIHIPSSSHQLCNSMTTKPVCKGNSLQSNSSRQLKSLHSSRSHGEEIRESHETHQRSMNSIIENEEKTQRRSFIDCLSDVFTGTWKEN